MTSKVSRKTLTIEQKIDVINDYERKGLSVREVAEKYGIGKSTVSDIVKKKRKYEEEFALSNPKMKNLKRMCVTSDLNELVQKFVIRANAANVPLTGTIIQTKATALAKEMNIENFKASEGWLTNFKKRYNIRFGAYCGESSEVDTSTCENWKSKLNDLTKGYSLDCIYNCDETGLFFKAIPTKSFFTKFANRKGVKTAKQRVTILLACNAKGEKLQPLVIGRAAKPRCFKKIDYNKNSLPVHYFSNQNAWMTMDIFKNWLQIINKEMELKKKIVMFLDNCCSHKMATSHYSHAKLIFFPPNTTSVLQPLDAGIIRVFKAHCRHLLMTSLVAGIESSSTPQGFSKSVTILDAINWTEEAWNQVAETTIYNCFKHVGFSTDSESFEISADCLSENELSLSQIMNSTFIEDQVTQEEYLTIDTCLETEEHLDAETCFDSLLLEAKQFQTEVAVIIESDEEDDNCELQIPTLHEAKEAADILKKFINYSEEDINPLTPIIKISTVLDNIIVKKKLSNYKQRTITEFFRV